MKKDYQKRRLTDRVEELQEEQKRVTRRILQTRRDEEFELNHTRRKFSAIIQQLETSQAKIAKELERRERELRDLEKRLKDKSDEDEEGVDDAAGHRRHYF